MTVTANPAPDDAADAAARGESEERNRELRRTVKRLFGARPGVFLTVRRCGLCMTYAKA